MTQHILMKMLDGQKHIIIRGKNKRSPIKKKKKSKKQTEAPLQLRVQLMISIIHRRNKLSKNPL